MWLSPIFRESELWRIVPRSGLSKAENSMKSHLAGVEVGPIETKIECLLSANSGHWESGQGMKNGLVKLQSKMDAGMLRIIGIQMTSVGQKSGDFLSKDYLSN
jgi:hypothetical protein